VAHSGPPRTIREFLCSDLSVAMAPGLSMPLWPFLPLAQGAREPSGLAIAGPMSSVRAAHKGICSLL